MSQKQLHINVNILSSGSHSASWRAPYGNPLGYVQVEHYQEIARVAERGLLDGIFLAHGGQFFFGAVALRVADKVTGKSIGHELQ